MLLTFFFLSLCFADVLNSATGAGKDGKGPGLLGAMLAGGAGLGALLGGAFGGKKDDKDDRDKPNKEDGDPDEINEMKELLKKKPDDMTGREKKRLKELQGRINVENALTEKELKALSAVTGYKPKDDSDDSDDGSADTGSDNTGDEEVTEDQMRLLRLKGLNELRKAIEAHADDDSEDAKKMRDLYNTTIGVMYDEDGNERSPEEMKKAYNDLPDNLKSEIDKGTKMDLKDPKVKDAIEDFKKAPFTEKDVNVLNAQVKVDIAKKKKADELNKLEEQKQEELKNCTDDEKRKEIEEKYKAKAKEVSDVHDVKIKEAEDAVTAAKNAPSKEEKEQLEAELKELKKAKDDAQKIADGDEEAVKNEIARYRDLAGHSDKLWEGLPAEISAEDAADSLKDGGDEGTRKKVEEFLKKKNINPDILRKVSGGAKDEDLTDDVKTEAKTRITEIDKEIKDKTAKVD